MNTALANPLSGLPAGTAVIYAWAPWCGPCRTMSPAIERVAASFADRVPLIKVDGAAEPQLAHELGILAVPTVILWRNGREVSRSTGALPEAMLQDLFAAAAAGETPPRAGLDPLDRGLRLTAGLALLALGWLNGPALVLLVAGALALFSAVHDRCPLRRALAHHLHRLLAPVLPGR